VAWEGPSGGPHRAGSDCFGESPGTSIEVLVPRNGSDDGVTSAAVLWLTGAAVSAALAGAGALRLLIVGRRRRAYRASLKAVGALGFPAAHGAAIGVERTAAALRRTARNAWAVVALGVVCFIVFAALFTVMTRADSALRSEGGRAGGTVL
jgi:type IV secretory pathway TrbD component